MGGICCALATPVATSNTVIAKQSMRNEPNLIQLSAYSYQLTVVGCQLLAAHC